MIQRSFRFRLAPTARQEEALQQFLGVTRFVYNLAWEQRRDWWRQYRAATGGRLNYASQGREVTALRREFGWIAAVPVTCLTQALRDLDRAFAAYFRGLSKFPTPRRRGVNDSFRFQVVRIPVRPVNRRWAALRIPNIGLVKFRTTRPLSGRCQSVTIAKDALGWFASIACEIDCQAVADNDNPPVGIDRGVACTLVLSNGETMSVPDIAQLDRRKKRWQRTLARRQRGSRRHGKARRRVATIAARIARVRRDWQHRASTDIARRFGPVALEKLRIASMTAKGRGKRALNRSILEQGWGAFAAMLQYKLEERGGALVYVPAAYTSQTCSECGSVDARSRKNQAVFECVDCGFAANADHNAAINILRRSTSKLPVEEAGCGSDEAGTMREAA